MDVEVPYYQKGEPKIQKMNFRLDGVDPMVSRVGGVGINDSEGVKIAVKKRFMGGDVQSNDFVSPSKPGEHHVVRKKRHIKVGGNASLPNPGKK